MKILFLQNTDDSLGGIANVNISLMQKFLADGEDVSLISMRHLGKFDKINYPAQVNRIVVNAEDRWGCPRYGTAIQYLKHGKLLQFVKTIFARWMYDSKIKRDYSECKNIISQMRPDVIINSHYELLDAIPEEFLKKTINHFHTSFDQVLANRSYMQIFNRYKDKIAQFVWLSSATCERAKEAGFVNSRYIYNPLAFSSEKTADAEQKRIVFIGRFSEEKRLDRAVRMFGEVIGENKIEDWSFDIYGTGQLDAATAELIEKTPHVTLKGSTSNPKETLMNYSLFMLTSSFEGMALVVLEANECGLPVICFNFGESVFEEVIDKETGFIVEQDDEGQYKEKLLLLMRDTDLRKAMSENAKTFVKKFSVDAVAEQWYELFQLINDGK